MDTCPAAMVPLETPVLLVQLHPAVPVPPGAAEVGENPQRRGIGPLDGVTIAMLTVNEEQTGPGFVNVLLPGRQRVLDESYGGGRKNA